MPLPNHKVVETHPGEKSPTLRKHSGGSRHIQEKLIRPVFIDGAWILPFIQGGKGVGATNGKNAGAWAAENAGGTIAGIGAAIGYDENGRPLSYPFEGRTRPERHEELVAWSIKGGILQAGFAHEASRGKGRVRINFLKEAGGTMRIMRGVLAGTRGTVNTAFSSQFTVDVTPPVVREIRFNGQPLPADGVLPTA